MSAAVPYLTFALIAVVAVLLAVTVCLRRAARERDDAHHARGEAMAQASRLRVERDELAVQVHALRGRLLDRGLEPSEADRLLAGVADVDGVLLRLEARTWGWQARRDLDAEWNGRNQQGRPS